MPPPSPQLATPNGFPVPAVARPTVIETRLPIWATPTTAPSTGLLSERLFGNRKPEDNLLYSKQANPLGERRTLADHERLGGHTTRDHVGKSETQLRNRLLGDSELEAASSFRNEDAANRTVGQFIKQNKEAIINWLQSGRHDYRGTVEMDESVGIVVGRGKGGSVNRGTAAETNKAFFMLVKDDSPQGWHILTSYPIK